jgi:hypothetical protein
MKTLRNYIKKVLSESSMDSHRCLDGNSVPIDSQVCYDDVCIRIEDAVETRNDYPLQSDSREHYNGLLKVLRRKKRKSKKFIDTADI